jgi:2-oxoglutarate ferredoxin oxidoreductase subunit beta
MGRPELNTVIVAGDGDFLSIGAEHIGPAAQRNVDLTCVIMDNGVYGLTKGQSSPTTLFGKTTSSTPFGKIEQPLHPLKSYLTMGVSYIASHYSSKPRVLAQYIQDAMEHKGFSIVHVQSPCTTYNDTYDIMKGDPKKGIAGTAWEVPEDHDPTSRQAASELLDRPGIPLGLIYRDPQPTLEDRQNAVREKHSSKSAAEVLETYAV